MVFILKVNNIITGKKFEPHCLRAPGQFLINTVAKTRKHKCRKQNNANFSDNEKP